MAPVDGCWTHLTTCLTQWGGWWFPAEVWQPNCILFASLISARGSICSHAWAVRKMTLLWFCCTLHALVQVLVSCWIGVSCWQFCFVFQCSLFLFLNYFFVNTVVLPAWPVNCTLASSDFVGVHMVLHIFIYLLHHCFICIQK